MSITAGIKEFGQSLGYCSVGVTTADDFDEYLETLNARENYEFILKNNIVAPSPRRMMPSAKSIIVLILDYRQKSIPENLDNMIGSIYLARCYNPRPNSLNGARLQLMVDYLEGLGYEVRADLKIPARPEAARAGVATIGRNNFAYTDGIGSYLMIYTLAVDQELEYDPPTLQNKCPENCTICIDSCPTQAMLEPFHLDPRKCISYNNWMTREVPIELREKIGSRIHGCDKCQQVCPRNKKVRDKLILPKDEYLERISKDLTLTAILNMDDEFFETRIQPIMYNYISEPKMFRRNAIIAMGNSGDPAYIEDLEQAMEGDDDLIREYAGWALEQIKRTTGMRNRIESGDV